MILMNEKDNKVDKEELIYFSEVISYSRFKQTFFIILRIHWINLICMLSKKEQVFCLNTIIKKFKNKIKHYNKCILFPTLELFYLLIKIIEMTIFHS